MSEQTSQDQEKVEAYLSVIQDRILAPIQTTEIGNYCTATLLLLFAAMDGLGKLLDPSDKAGPMQRLRTSLDHMGGDYAAYERELLALRNSVVHNAINVASFLSHTGIGGNQHLKRVGAAGFIYVNTSTLYTDFLDALTRFRADIQQDPEKLGRAARRLEWREDSPLYDLDISDTEKPSPPPPVQFIYAR
jgi:hypothetical protein